MYSQPQTYALTILTNSCHSSCHCRSSCGQNMCFEQRNCSILSNCVGIFSFIAQFYQSQGPAYTTVSLLGFILTSFIKELPGMLSDIHEKMKISHHVHRKGYFPCSIIGALVSLFSFISNFKAFQVTSCWL